MKNFYNPFFKLGLNNKFSHILNKLNFKNPFPIQKICIPEILKNFDILGIANTGSGKTITFILPILEKINKNIKYTQSIILVPTRELAIQIYNVINLFSRYIRWINFITIYGGQNFNLQLNLLKKIQHIIIATPGRLIDHINKNTINLSYISILVIDEADEMLKMGFIDDINIIVSKIPKNRQTLLFSATMSNNLKKISYKYIKNNNFKEFIINNKYDDKININQYYYIINNFTYKKEVLINFLLTNNFSSIIIFVNTKNETVKISNFIREFKYNCLYLNGDMKQFNRENVIKLFRLKKLSILVATDVASRGLDIKNIDWVINFDCPLNEDSYIHRIGRTGRAGLSGKSLTFFTLKEFKTFKNYKNKNINLKLIKIKKSNSLLEIKIKKIIEYIEKKHFSEHLTNIDSKYINLILDKFNNNYNILLKTLLKIIIDKNLII